MKKYLLLGLSLALVSCAGTKPLPHYSAAEQQAQRDAIGFWQPQPAKPDSTSGIPRAEPGSQADLIRHIFEGKPPVVQVEVEAAPDSLPFVKVERQPSLLSRLFGRKPQTAIYVGQSSIQAGKKSTITINKVMGNQTNSTATTGKKATGAAGPGAVASVIEKKAGPAQVASDSSTQNALLGGGNLAAVHGDGNTLPQTATTQEASDWRAELAKPAGEVAATALGLVIVAGIVWAIIAYKRRKALSSNA